MLGIRPTHQATTNQPTTGQRKNDEASRQPPRHATSPLPLPRSRTMADYNRYGHSYSYGGGGGYGQGPPPSAPPAPHMPTTTTTTSAAPPSSSSSFSYGGYPPPPAAAYPPPPAQAAASGFGSGYGYGSGYGSGFVPVAFPPGTHPEVERAFRSADRDCSGAIDERELQGALSSAYHRFSIRTVRLLMFLFNDASSSSSTPSRMGN